MNKEKFIPENANPDPNVYPSDAERLRIDLHTLYLPLIIFSILLGTTAIVMASFILMKYGNG